MILDELSAELVRVSAENAIVEAKLAAEAGSFAVGASLVGRDGAILARARNRVAGEESKRDPTAHAERRLIDWYYSRRAAGRQLPTENDLVIVGTVEPCMMCAGALLSTGISSLSLCEDAAAGVGISHGHQRLPSSLRSIAHQGMRLLGDARTAAPSSSPDLVREATALFATTLTSVRESVNQDSLRAVEAVPFGDQADWLTAIEAARKVGAQIAGVRLGEAQPIMPHGRNRTSPIGYPALELVRTIARRGLVSSLGGIERGMLQFVLAGGFESDAAIVTSLGAIGSFAEGPVGRSPYIVMQAVSGDAFSRATQIFDGFPPFYRDVIGLSLARET
jgi:tRNA(Arg) A34 adenosine deaminase TadA